MKLMNNKGVLGDLSASGKGFVVLAILLGIGALILAEIQADPSITTDGYADMALANGTESIGTMAKFMPLLALVIVLGAVLFVVVRMLRG